MKKFPVTSKNNNEYLAKVYRGRYTEMRVSLYTKKPFMFGKHRFKRVFDSGMLFMVTNHRKTDYVGMVEYTVAYYEEEIRRKNYEEIERKAQLEKFEEWDGDCR